MTRCVLLLRAVNVGGTSRVPMAELRSALAEHTGLARIETYIQSGNIICDAPPVLTDTCAEVRALILRQFGINTPVIPRLHEQLVASVAASSFGDPPAAVETRVHAMFLEAPAHAGAIENLTPRLGDDEQLAMIGDDLWIRYGEGGAARTKLTKSVLDRALGVAGTARNLRTVRELIARTA